MNKNKCHTPVKVGIKFCGNCNPVIDARKLYGELEQRNRWEGKGCIELVAGDYTGVEILLVISGCLVDCATRPEGNFKEIVVAGETLNVHPCPREKLALEAWKMLQDEVFNRKAGCFRD